MSKSLLDLNVYEYTLDCGLKLYIVPKEGTNKYATLTTKYGDKDIEFYVDGKEIKVPLGSAHFLEHKVFEQENKIDPFSFYSESGADVNASTSLNITTYKFSGESNFETNLNFLLNFVYSPHFTNENVEKEKGIIIEELAMYLDNPSDILYKKNLFNSFHVNPVKYAVGGTIETVSKITKEDLYKMYDNFYHPSNMVLIITGNVEQDIMYEIVKNNEKIKNYRKKEIAKIKKYKEKDNVVKEKEIVTANVITPKVSVNYKLNIEKIKDLFSLKLALSLLFNIKFSETSLLNEKLKKESIIHFGLSRDLTFTDTHILLSINGEADLYEELISSIKEELKDTTITEEELNRKKKIFISSNVYMSDNIFAINHKILSNYLDYDEVIYDDDERIRKFNIETYNEIMSKLDFSNISTVVVKGEY